MLLSTVAARHCLLLGASEIPSPTATLLRPLLLLQRVERQAQIGGAPLLRTMRLHAVSRPAMLLLLLPPLPLTPARRLLVVTPLRLRASAAASISTTMRPRIAPTAHIRPMQMSPPATMRAHS